MILKNALNFGGRLYEAGESVKGKLPLDMIEVLKEKGAFEEATETDAPITGDDIVGGQQSKDDRKLGYSPNGSVAELEEYLRDVHEIEEVTSLLDHEKESDQPRSSAIKALEKRQKELQDE